MLTTVQFLNSITLQEDTGGLLYKVVEHESGTILINLVRLSRTKIAPAKTEVAIGEIITISLQWLVFDLTQESYITDIENTAPFNVTVGGQSGEVTAINGAGEFTFSSNESGTYKIIVNDEELEVIVNA